ncbi:MAG: hypothetical protein H7Z42_08225 [Roseiflexaceae bacterium]|nr:hypothetical protein [Roseiflexaceae bacterium]
MIEIDLAHQLHDAGLVWRPAPLDFFALPDREIDEIYVISDQSAFLQLYNGYPVVAFHGASEWALDYILLNEVVWMPTEGQLREQIERRIPAAAVLRLERTSDGYRCAAGSHTLDAPTAAAALGLMLLQLLRDDTRPIDDR